MSQMLNYFYKNFQKDFIARFTQVIAERPFEIENFSSIELTFCFLFV